MEEILQRNACQHRKQHHLHNGKYHGPERNLNPGSSQQIGQSRGQNRCQQCGSDGHAHRKGHISSGNVRDDIAGRAPGAASHQNDADGQIRRKAEEAAEGPCHKRHDCVLTAGTQKDVFRMPEHHAEIRDVDGEAHAEHGGAQEEGGVIHRP